MKITVVIPFYNRVGFCKKALESVLSQSVQPYEILLVNDGSSDDIEELEKYNVRLINISQNKGVSYARNLAIKTSSPNTNWIAFLDSDDIWHRDKLQKQINFHEQNKNIKISQTQEIWIRNNNQVLPPKSVKKYAQNIFLKCIYSCVITTSSVMIHKDIFEDIGCFDENFEVCEDYDLWLRIARKYLVGLIDEPLITKFAGHENQLSFKYWGMDRFRIKALLKHKDDKKYSKSIKDEIIKKCTILINGANKRNNNDLALEYTKLLDSL